MTDALIGHTGFVGSNLERQHAFGALYNSKNIEKIRAGVFETLVFCGTRAAKWWANQNPDADWASIEAALGPLRSVTAKRAILISTIDVVPCLTGVTEDFDCHTPGNHAYGVNRLRLEDEFKTIFGVATIVRLPALFGPGLKKNVVFDLLNQNILEKIERRSRFQYYDLERLWGDIALVTRKGIGLMHLFPEPVGTQEIIDAFFPGLAVGTDPLPVVSYDVRTRHAGLYGRNDGYIYGKAEVMERLGRFIAAARGAAR
jgi:hypothetical protein